MREATESARNDYDASSAVIWAEGYEFPPAFISTACLAEAEYDFEAMMRWILELLSSDCLSLMRVEGLRADNPERWRVPAERLRRQWVC